MYIISSSREYSENFAIAAKLSMKSIKVDQQLFNTVKEFVFFLIK